MITKKQKETAQANIKKAQQKWQEMTPRERALAQPEGRKRAKPGTKGEGDYFRIMVRPKDEFSTFRYQDVGEKGHILAWPAREAADPGIHMPGSSAKTMPILKAIHWSPITRRPDR